MRGFRLSRIKFGFFILGIILMIVSTPDIIALMKPGVDINYTNAGDIKSGMHVKTDVYFVYDYCATMSTEHSNYGVVTHVDEDVSRFYIVPVFMDDSDDPYYLLVRVGKKDYDSYEEIANISYDYLMGNSEDYGYVTTPLDGRTKKLDSEIKQYFIEWYGTEYASEAEQYLIPYYVMPLNPVPTIVLELIGVICLVLGACWILIPYLASRKTSKVSNSYYDGSQGMYENSTGTDNQYANTEYSNAYQNQNGSDKIYIAGVGYTRDDLERVNYYVNEQRTSEAVSEFMMISGMDELQAKSIIDNWSRYFC